MSVGFGNVIIQQKRPAGGGGGGGVTTLAPIGAVPNANGATISGVTLNLQPASQTFGGVVTTLVQQFQGGKNFRSYVAVNGFQVASNMLSVTGDAVVGNGNVPLFPTFTVGAGSASSAQIIIKTQIPANYVTISGDGGLNLFGNSTYPTLNFYAYPGDLLSLRVQNLGVKVVTAGGRISCTSTDSSGVAQGAIQLDRTINLPVDNHRGFRDGSVFTMDTAVSIAYASFDANQTMTAAVTRTINHTASFQSRPVKSGLGDITTIYDFVAAVAAINDGTVINKYGFYAFPASFSGTGALTNYYGVYIPDLAGATNKYGGYFENNVGFGVAIPLEKIHVVGNIRFTGLSAGTNINLLPLFRDTTTNNIQKHVPETYSITPAAPSRTFNYTTATLAQTAQTLATLIQDLQAINIFLSA